MHAGEHMNMLAEAEHKSKTANTGILQIKCCMPAQAPGRHNRAWVSHGNEGEHMKM